jgi:hypothetical protein
VPSIIAKLRDLEAQQQALRVDVARLRPVPRLAPAVIENRLAEWRRLLRSSTTQGRTVLQRILRGRLTFTPHVNPVSGEVDGYDFEAPTRFDKLFTGVAVERPASLESSQAGTEGIGPEDTHDADYGRLLEQATAVSDKNVKGVASPRGLRVNYQPVFRGEWRDQRAA